MYVSLLPSGQGWHEIVTIVFQEKCVGTTGPSKYNYHILRLVMLLEYLSSMSSVCINVLMTSWLNANINIC